ncbi:MAG TPA: glycosyltransferase [Leptolyngbyaceae cyanobacterium]
MRILITADPELPVPPPLYGGVQRLVDSLVTGMQDRGHIVGLVAHPESTSPAEQFFPFPGIQSQQKLDTLQNIVTLCQAIQKFQPDLVHSFSRLIYLLPFLASPLPKVMSYGRKPSPIPVRWGAKLAGNSLVFAACSQHICRQGESVGGIWQTIYNWIDVDKYTFQPTVDSDAPLVFLSRVERIKGAHTAIAAARQTKRRLLIAGNHSTTGEERRYWQEEILPHLGQDGIEYIGPVNDEQKNALLGKAAAMIVPIQWEEPFGMVFAEALACGTPVISCPMGALPEIVRHGIDGYLINNIEEACTAIQNLSQIDRKNCHQRAETCFSATKIIDKYEELYNLMIANLV